MNKKVLSLKKKIILSLNLFSSMIFIIASINILLANINRKFSIADIDYIFSKIFLVINLILNLSLLLILI